MDSKLRSDLLQYIRSIIVKRQAFRDISAVSELGILNAEGSFQEIVSYVDSILEDPMEELSSQELEILTDISMMSIGDYMASERILINSVDKLDPDFRFPTDQDQVEALEILVNDLISMVRQTKELNIAKPYLDMIEEASRKGALLGFSGDAILSDEFKQIIEDFEHLDEEAVARGIFEDIKARKSIYR